MNFFVPGISEILIYENLRSLDGESMCSCCIKFGQYLSLFSWPFGHTHTLPQPNSDIRGCTYQGLRRWGARGHAPLLFLAIYTFKRQLIVFCRCNFLPSKLAPSTFLVSSEALPLSSLCNMKAKYFSLIIDIGFYIRN